MSGNQTKRACRKCPQQNMQNKKAHKSKGGVKYPSFLCTYTYIFNKSSHFNIKQSHAKSPGFQSIAKFTDIVRKCQQEKLCLCLPLPTCEKPSESIIFLDYSECSFHLDRSIHTKFDSLRCIDPLRCFPFLSGKGLGQRNLPVFVLSLETFLPVQLSQM